MQVQYGDIYTEKKKHVCYIDKFFKHIRWYMPDFALQFYFVPDSGQNRTTSLLLVSSNPKQAKELPQTSTDKPFINKM